MPYLYRRSYIGVLSSWWYWILMFDNILLISLWFHSDFRCQHQQCYKIPYRNIIFTVNYLNKIVWVRITFLIKRRHSFERDFDAKLWIKKRFILLYSKKEITEVWHVKTVEKLQWTWHTPFVLWRRLVPNNDQLVKFWSQWSQNNQCQFNLKCCTCC